MDPLRRWIGLFPIQNGGAVLTFTGERAEIMEVEATLEMNAVVGYEDFGCDRGVVVWVPGIECDGAVGALALYIEEGTTMSHLQTSCFAVDEIGMRLEMECNQGALSGDFCP